LNLIKQLAGQTAVYGFSSIVARILNYLLVPLYTRVFDVGEYGVVTELYAYVAILIVMLTYGLETGYFRFSRGREEEESVFSTAIFSLLITGLLFSSCCVLFSDRIGEILGEGHRSAFIWILGVTVSIDALVAIPFARLRLQQKAWKFALFKTINIAVNILLNLIFLLGIPFLRIQHPEISFLEFFPEDFGVGYIFLSNLIASLVCLALFIPSFVHSKIRINWRLYKNLILYSLPLMLAGLAGILNETIDRIILKYRSGPHLDAMAELGIYGANIKIAVLMTLFVQMYRYAVEPFFFSHYKDNRLQFGKVYSEVNRYFIYAGILVYTVIYLFIDVFQFLIGENFREGIGIVPIVLASNLLLGVFFNLSFWYKLEDKTRYAAYITMLGVIVTVLVNWIYVPEYSYHASAWAHLLSAFSMTAVSYYFAKKVIRLNVKMKRILSYLLISAFMLIVYNAFEIEKYFFDILLRMLIVLILLVFVILIEGIKLKNIYRKT
jgi:O-antigen/teichoic acid export membrane protein